MSGRLADSSAGASTVAAVAAATMLVGIAVGAVVTSRALKTAVPTDIERLVHEADAFEQLVGRRECKLGNDLNKELSDISTRVLQYAFDRLDREKLGYLTPEQLRRGFVEDRFGKALFERYCKRTVDQVVASMDRDGDGRITLGEFLLFFEQRSSVSVSYHYGCLSAMNFAKAEDRHVWGYKGVIGPKNWSRLSTKNAAASSGTQQSPINVLSSKLKLAEDLPPLQFVASPSAHGTLVENGHTLVMNFQGEAARLVVDGRAYQLKQFHFHSESEHLLDGMRFPLELHLVHIAEDGSNAIAVVGVLFRIGKPCAFLGQFSSRAAEVRDKGSVVLQNVSFDHLNIHHAHTVRYDGSLTTPPCSEGVKWTLLREPCELSEAQLSEITALMPLRNFRPVQPLNGRDLLAS